MADSVKADNIEVGGIKLKGDKAFAVPVPVNMEHGITLDPLWFPERGKDPTKYHYFEKVDNVPGAIAQGFRPVTRAKAGFVNVEGLPKEYGLDSGEAVHRVHDLVLMEGPIELYNKIDKERQAVANAAIRPILKRRGKEERTHSAMGIREESEQVTQVSPAKRFDAETATPPDED